MDDLNTFFWVRSKLLRRMGNGDNRGIGSWFESETSQVRANLLSTWAQSYLYDFNTCMITNYHGRLIHWNLSIKRLRFPTSTCPLSRLVFLPTNVSARFRRFPAPFFSPPPYFHCLTHKNSWKIVSQQSKSDDAYMWSESVPCMHELVLLFMEPVFFF